VINSDAVLLQCICRLLALSGLNEMSAICPL
jgi:hypothetical protein